MLAARSGVSRWETERYVVTSKDLRSSMERRVAFALILALPFMDLENRTDQVRKRRCMEEKDKQTLSEELGAFRYVLIPYPGCEDTKKVLWEKEKVTWMEGVTVDTTIMYCFIAKAALQHYEVMLSKKVVKRNTPAFIKHGIIVWDR